MAWGAAGAAPDYATEVRPIFEQSCYDCHGPERQRGGYRLDVRSIAIRGGDSGSPAIQPHDAAASPLIRYVSGLDEAMHMPPKRSRYLPLTPEEIETLRAWIDAGPVWPDELAGELEEKPPHWSLEPLERPAVPDGGARHPIDAFIEAKLAEHGLEPAPEADARTLIRRVYQDLTGLPPTPEAVAAFEADSSPAAYESVVDDLLASPRHGERWARHWLDTIHFADSHGYEHDIAREHAWRYRDYVIDALNNDTPWPRFVREQLAADVFYPDEPWLTPALGFLGAGTFDLSTYLTATVTFDYLDRDDLVTQTAAAFLSTTANCARCHTHKFDPIPQDDYYALQAVFSGVLKGDVAYDPCAEVASKRRQWRGVLDNARANRAEAFADDVHDSEVRDWLARRGAGATWAPLEAETYVSTGGATLTRGPDGAIVASGRRPDTDTYNATATVPLDRVTALRLDAVPLEAFPNNGPGRAGNGNFHLNEFEVRVFAPGASEPTKLAFRRVTADFNQADWPIEHAVDGDDKTAWGIHPAAGEAHHAVFELDTPLDVAPGTRFAFTLKHLHGERHAIGAFRLAATADAPEQVVAMPKAVHDAMAVPEGSRSPEQRAAVRAYVLRFVAEEQLAALPEQEKVYAAAATVDIPNGDPNPLIRSLDSPKPVHLLERGDFDKPREEVQPGALSALAHLPARFELPDDAPEGLRRAALADWIAHPDNVLAWRSIVNRVWHYHFGRGLCDTPSDFGEMGGTPSHPELLDWLACWFRDDARGSLKALHRLIVTSATYRQASHTREAAAAIDADNRLLWRQNRHRLDAGAYRDHTLAVSGRLDLTMGGPGVQHFSQGKGPQLTPALDYTAYDWNDPGAGRRSIYRMVWRGIPDPFMEALDFPDLGLLAPVREFSASPLQALALYNNDFVLAHSAALAKRVQQEAPDLAGQVSRAVQLVWLRTPTPTEHASMQAYAETHGLPALCRVLLNSNEYLFVD